MKSLDKAANVAVIVGVAAFLVVLARHEWAVHSPPESESALRTSLTGKNLHAPGLEFPRPRRSVVLALSVGCHFCVESVPFYRQLAAKSQGKFDLIAVFPQAKPVAEQYLRDAVVPVNEVVSAPLNTINVSGTPTLILVDRDGRIQDLWVGRLSEAREKQVLARLSISG
jgi:hypothetical protein